MKRTSRQLIVGSLQPFLFCVGMYFVVLIFSVFVCSSIFRATHGSSRGSLTMHKTPERQLTGGTTAMVTAFK
jgi:hypothetical protein